MVRSVVPPDEVVVSIVDDGVAVWLRSEGASRTKLESAARTVLGSHGALRTLDLQPDAAAAAGRDTVDAIVAPVAAVAGALARRDRGAESSASVQWVLDAAWVASALCRTGRLIPRVAPAGVRWSATWQPVLDDPAADLVDELREAAPAAVFAATGEAPPVATAGFVRTLVDALARAALRDAGWRPDLPRSRAAAVVAVRRALTALGGDDAVFVCDSISQELSVARWSADLSAIAGRLAGAPDVGFQARLVAPPDTRGAWRLVLEAIAHDATVGFDDVWADRAAATAIGESSERARLRVRMHQVVEAASDQIAACAAFAANSHPYAIELTASEVADLAEESADRMAAIGLPIVRPAELERARGRLTMRAHAAADPAAGDLGTAMVDVDWGVALGGLRLSRDEIDELARTQAGVVALRGRWLSIDPREVSALLSSLDHRRTASSTMTAPDFLRESLAIAETDDFSADGWMQQLLDGLPDDRLEPVTESADFDGALRPYQRRALGWLQFLARLGLGGCLADDMGLGKTPTALAHLLTRTDARRTEGRERRPHLVICPLSIVHNWEAEAGRFTPQLDVLVVHGASRPRGETLVRTAADHDLVITTYGTISRIIDEIEGVDWDVVVCDEAQAIKNHNTNAALAVRRLASSQRIALTGTPIENRLTELWAILDACNPGMLGGVTWFRTQFANPIENDDDGEARDRLRRVTAPFVLRRTKADRSLVPDLPPKIEQVAWAPLTPEQAGLYQAVLDDFLERAATAGGMERRGLVLATLTRLKQICNHPAHFLGDDDLGGTDRSGKLTRFDELLDLILDADERALVFTQYREMGTLLATHVADRLGHEVPFLHGGTTLAGRRRMVDSFQSPDGTPVQLISLRAGGTGLNLTAASRVIHFDRWWNPAVEDQATDRSWRIGQTRTVFVHTLVCQGTLEERIDALLARKRQLADSVVGTDEAWLTELSTDELRDLLRLDASATPDAEPQAVIG